MMVKIDSQKLTLTSCNWLLTPSPNKKFLVAILWNWNTSIWLLYAQWFSYMQENIIQSTQLRCTRISTMKRYKHSYIVNFPAWIYSTDNGNGPDHRQAFSILTGKHMWECGHMHMSGDTYASTHIWATQARFSSLPKASTVKHPWKDMHIFHLPELLLHTGPLKTSNANLFFSL